jgi:hypothetical protein
MAAHPCVRAAQVLRNVRQEEYPNWLREPAGAAVEGAGAGGSGAAGAPGAGPEEGQGADGGEGGGGGRWVEATLAALGIGNGTRVYLTLKVWIEYNRRRPRT